MVVAIVSFSIVFYIKFEFRFKTNYLELLGTLCVLTMAAIFVASEAMAAS